MSGAGTTDASLLALLRSFGLMNRLETPFDYDRLKKFRSLIAYLNKQAKDLAELELAEREAINKRLGA